MVKKTTKPQDDLYNYINATWLNKTKIPDNEVSWGNFNILNKKNDSILKKIVENISKQSNKNDSIESKIAILYKQKLDISSMNKLGIKPIQPLLNTINNISTISDITSILIKLHQLNIYPLFNIGSGEFKDDSNFMILYISQSGLSLPSKDYYFDKDKKHIVEKYKNYIFNQFVNFGHPKDDTTDYSKRILDFEIKLATIFVSKTEMRDSDKTYNTVKLKDLIKLNNNIDWKTYLTKIGIKNVDKVNYNIHNKKYFEKLNKLLQNTYIEDIKLYLKWKIMNNFSSSLTKKLYNEKFNFYNKIINGQKKKKPHWNLALNAVEGYLGEGLGKIYIIDNYNNKKCKIIEEMIENIKSVYAERIEKLTWMSEKTKEKAIIKLKNMNFKIGHPKKWESYNKLKVSSNNSYIENIIEGNKFHFNDDINKCYKKTDKNEWHMYPQTINAYYNPPLNEMVFPAAIFNEPFFYENNIAKSYGGIGAVIGHEITHGFDDQGSKYDKDGNFNDWWTKEDREKFTKRTQMIVKQFDSYSFHNTQVNGSLTQGESIADLGGLTVAYHAYQKYMKKYNIKSINYKNEKQLFYNFANVWKNKRTKESLINQITTDPHPPTILRVNVTVSNMPEFYEVFNVKKGDKLYRDEKDRVSIW